METETSKNRDSDLRQRVEKIDHQIREEIISNEKTKGKTPISEIAKIESADLPSGDPGLGTPVVSQEDKESTEEESAA